MNKDDLKIIISRTDNIGDVVLTLPIAGFLKFKYPNSIIYFIGKAYTRPVIELSEAIDFFLDREDILLNPSKMAEIKADIIFFIFPDYKLAALAKKVSIPLRIGTSHRWFHWIYCNRRVSFSRRKSELHEAQLNFKLLKPLFPDLEMPLDEVSNYYQIRKRGSPASQTIQKNLFQLIIHPKSKGSAREWGLDNYYELIKQLDPLLFKILLTGVKEEEQQVKTDKPEIFELPGVDNKMGKLSLDEMISLIAESDGLLACSTGVLHIAAAMGKFALGIYAPMKPIHPGRWMPIGKKANFLVLDKDCSDCRKKELCQCILDIQVKDVLDKIKQAQLIGD